MDRKFRYSRCEVKKTDDPERFPVFQPHKKALSVEIPRIKQELNETIYGCNTKNHHKKPPLIIIKHSDLSLNSKSGINVNYSNNKKPATVNFPNKIRKLIPIHFPEKEPQLKINGKSSKLNKIIEDGYYFKLLEFHIKVSLEFSPIFHKIDIDKKGFVIISEVRSYFSGIYPSFVQQILVFCQLLQAVCADQQISKSEFLSTCALIRYEQPISDAKSSILGVDYQKISSLLKVLQGIYYALSEIASPKCENVRKRYSGSKEELEKCFKFIFSEPLDFLRFLRVFPIFLWLIPE